MNKMVMLLDTHVQSVGIPTFGERSAESSEKLRDIYISVCASSMCVLFYPINAFIAIKCYKSRRSFAILVVAALQLSDYMDEISLLR